MVLITYRTSWKCGPLSGIPDGAPAWILTVLVLEDWRRQAVFYRSCSMSWFRCSKITIQRFSIEEEAVIDLLMQLWIISAAIMFVVYLWPRLSEIQLQTEGSCKDNLFWRCYLLEPVAILASSLIIVDKLVTIYITFFIFEDCLWYLSNLPFVSDGFDVPIKDTKISWKLPKSAGQIAVHLITCSWILH